MSRNQFGTVDIEQRLALFDAFADKIHVQLLYPAVELDIDRIYFCFVVGYGSESANGFAQGRRPNGCNPDPHILDGRRVDANGRRRQLFTALFLVNRNEIHAHRRFSRLVADIGGVHRCGPVFDFFPGCRIDIAGLQAGDCLRQSGKNHEVQ